MTYKLNDLKKLISSLSSAEKRHFSLLSMAFSDPGKEPLYLQLYQELSQSKTEHSERKDAPRSMYANTVKNRLFKNLRKSLRMYHQEQSVEIRIQNYLSDIELLYGLSLPYQSLYLLQRAYKEAITYEKFRLLLQVLEWERKLNIILDRPTRSINEIAIEEKEVLRKLLQIVNLENIYGKAKDMKRQQGAVKGGRQKKLEQETVKAREMISQKDCASQKAKFYYHFTHALFYWMTYNHLLAYEHSKALVRLQIKAILPNDYLDGLLEHVTSCIQIGAFQEALTGLKNAAAHAAQYGLHQISSLNTRLFFYKTGYHLVIYNYMGKKDSLCTAIETAENNLARFENKMPMEARQVIYANLMNAYIGIGAIEKADQIWEQLFHKNSMNIRREIYDDLYLFRIFNLLQNKVYEVLPYTVLSAHRYYKQFQDKENNFFIERKLTSILLKRQHLDDKKSRQEALAHMRETLLDYIGTLKGANDFQEHYSFYVIWTQSILDEVPFYQSALEWHKNFRKKTPGH